MGYFGCIFPVCKTSIRGNSHLRGSYNTKEEAEKTRDDEQFGKLVTNGYKALEALWLTVYIHFKNVLLSNGYVQLWALLIGKRI